MATLNSLKQALRQKVEAKEPSQKQPLSEAQYSSGFDVLMQGSEWETYQNFVIPQLSRLVALLTNSRVHISVLEIGPGPKSLLGYLPNHLRQKITKYTALEPNGLFATRLEESLCSTSEVELPLPCLKSLPKILQIPFVLQDDMGNGIGTGGNDEKYDIILFCHSMYGMNPKHEFIEKAIRMLVERPRGGMVVIFHREALHLAGLVCHRTASFPAGIVSVPDDDETLDRFARFIAGFSMQDADVDEAIQIDWRQACRALGHHKELYPGSLLFSSPNTMMAFTQHGTSLPDLKAQVPFVNGNVTIKNREALAHRPAAIMRPTDIQHVQQCVLWALKHGVGLTILGGGHSDHCLWTNVVAIDMSAFQQIHILKAGEVERKSSSNAESFIIAGAGCKTGDIVRATMEVGLTVPLGARPSVGAGLWLQGGIGHLARQHGLACDAIVGAVVVSAATSQVLCIGHVPSQHWPVGAVRPEDDNEMLWAMKGAGTNFGIVIGITFKAYAAPTYAVRNWVLPLRDGLEAKLKLSDVDKVASQLPRNFSADAYLYYDNNQLHLGVTMFESSTSELALEMPTLMRKVLGPQKDFKIVESVGLFDTEMYVSGMHGGHGGGKTSSFKRCLFLQHIGATNVSEILVAAVMARPSPLCYLHLLHGGGAVCDVAANATAFGCRDWDFACVITGVWPRGEDGTEAARAAVEWVYNVAGQLLSLSSGAYGADLGPDPRDLALAAKAFGPNQQRLARLKHNSDPCNLLAYTCPLPEPLMEQKLIVLVTGETGVGKDYCADIWVSVITKHVPESLTVRAVSISDATKRAYAAATGADPSRLLCDRAYKEQHRKELTSFYKKQVRERPRLPEESFLSTVQDAADVDVLLITGMRDDAPGVSFSHLVPNCRLLEVRVEAGEDERQARRGCHDSDVTSGKNLSNSTSLDYRPLIFDNNKIGNDAAKVFAELHLLPFVANEDLQRLAHMVRQVNDFPRPGTVFQHVLGISQQPGGLALCTSLLQSHFNGDWTKVDAVVCCEAGSYVFASALALRVEVPLVLIREAGKLPTPTVSVSKPSSYISSLVSKQSKEKRIEMERDVVPKGATVVVVDDVLSTGETLCAVLQLLDKAGIGAEEINVMIVAEFPAQRGRALLRQRGFGKVNVQSLVVFGGA